MLLAIAQQCTLAVMTFALSNTELTWFRTLLAQRQAGVPAVCADRQRQRQVHCSLMQVRRTMAACIHLTAVRP